MSVPERRPPGAFLTPLILQAQKGDRKAFDALYEEHSPAVRAWCIRQLSSEPEGEQVAQEVFVRTWKCLSTFRGDCPFGHWLYSIATNLCENIRRTKRGRDAIHGLSLDGMDSRDQLLAGPVIEDGVVESIFVEQLRALIRDCALAGRPPWDALDVDIFHLLYEQNVETAREVAGRLGKSENTVKYRIYRHINPVLASVHARLQAEEETI